MPKHVLVSVGLHHTSRRMPNAASRPSCANTPRALTVERLHAKRIATPSEQLTPRQSSNGSVFSVPGGGLASCEYHPSAAALVRPPERPRRARKGPEGLERAQKDP
eukprot:CAMPEP_0195066478 /NCGR_PEP_ID=MMETSP0448-20130528/11821_1 /TAXON_ID=66468 /ORGANISM="Heterocapsa triquestra, Strain CCMP 448" /LENGTH=105 /DNA_ID=CAMNT_0040097735 /DNA_START=23 /DNA_END=336 /DNA_ORIENTATION=+